MEQKSGGSLGDLARQEKERKRKVAPAVRKLTDESDGAHQVIHEVFCVTNPCIWVKAKLPPDAGPQHGAQGWFSSYDVPLKSHTAVVYFGPKIPWSGAADEAEEGLDQGQEQYINTVLLEKRVLASHVEVTSMEQVRVEGMPARRVRFKGSTFAGPKAGTVLLVAIPEQIAAIGCVYAPDDVNEATAACQEIFDSLRFEIPDKYKAKAEPDPEEEKPDDEGRKDDGDDEEPPPGWRDSHPSCA
ncbi:MAG TPA: hypothetical protein VEW69_05010 [Alphaproteobacteria bacterium]|nr:hypothetical protein [Alphaproteobacteria bacterium]